MSSSPLVLLGPQRFEPTVGEVVRDIAGDGPVATVNAGWREREPDDGELDELLGGRSVNLGLYGRHLDVLERDPELAAADRRRRELLDELAALYRLRLQHAIAAVYAVQRLKADPALRAAEFEAAVEAVRELDRRHLAKTAQVHADFHAQWPLHERAAVAEHRDAITRLLEGVDAVAIAGGHVDELLACMHLFNFAAVLGDRPLVAWSAGAMALTERVVLFHDRAPQGGAYAEVWEAGLGLCTGVVVLPHARRRLRLEDRERAAVLARRFQPARCLPLDDGARVDVSPGAGSCPPGTRIIDADGSLATLEAA